MIAPHRLYQFTPLPAIVILLSVTACATSTMESRRQERAAAYQALSLEDQKLVDQGQIKVGMSSDAVYIAWGKPGEVLVSETEQGRTVTWLYHGSWLEESRYWSFREVHHAGGIFLERFLDRDYQSRSYVRAEIVLEEDRVVRWRTLPQPVQ
ncbi:MAG TPA: hypothetical protein VMS21_13075 [Methylomirabilota bacterium]|nr:hypothetical protein [Methylomirabilota bacterium]